LSPSLPAGNHVLRYGLFTARGKEGGRAGVKVDCAEVAASRLLRADNNVKCIVDDGPA
jgi:hypothetical protein